MAMALPDKSRIFNGLAKLPFPVRQSLLGTLYMMVPRRRAALAPLLKIALRDLPRSGRPLLPDPSTALVLPNGLCGLTGRIDVPTLMEGYARGMFVHITSKGPCRWLTNNSFLICELGSMIVLRSPRRTTAGAGAHAGRLRVRSLLGPRHN